MEAGRSAKKPKLRPEVLAVRLPMAMRAGLLGLKVKGLKKVVRAGAVVLTETT
jgi:hypothetical protein